MLTCLPELFLPGSSLLAYMPELFLPLFLPTVSQVLDCRNTAVSWPPGHHRQPAGQAGALPQVGGHRQAAQGLIGRNRMLM